MEASRNDRSLPARLAERREEIRSEILTRVYAVSDPTENGDPIYVDGLRAAVSAAIDYALESIEASPRNPPQIPPVLLVQARIAAREGIGLDTVLRRYFAGYALLCDLLIEEAEAMEMHSAALRGLLGTQVARFDHLLQAISAEYARESKSRPMTSEERRAKLIEGLLAGEKLDPSELAYELEGSHLGLIGKGPGIGKALQAISASLDRRLLLIRREEETTWAWLGGRRPFARRDLEAAIELSSGNSLAVGEPAEGIEGWRLSHRQAKAALPIALHGPESHVFYADVALLAAISQDELLSTSLRQIYLAPLDGERAGGEVAKATLRAYFDAGRNVSSAAATLGVNRSTVTNRFRSVEEAIGRPLDICSTEVDVALRLEQLGIWSQEPPISTPVESPSSKSTTLPRHAHAPFSDV